MRVALVLLALIFPASAHAVPTKWPQRAQVIANKTWHTPCASVDFAVTPLPANADGVPEMGQAWPGLCIVRISPTDGKGRPIKWMLFCATVLHEYGHLANYRDPLNPGDPIHSHKYASIMYPYVSGDRRCVR